MKLLIPEPPLQVLPSLAVAIGLNEALVLQQMHYLSLRKDADADGRVWLGLTVAEWREQFPFFSERTIRRVLKSLEDQGLVETRQGDGFDRRKWYTIAYSHLTKTSNRSGQFGRIRSGQIGRMYSIKDRERKTPLPPSDENVKWTEGEAAGEDEDEEGKTQTNDTPAQEHVSANAAEQETVPVQAEPQAHLGEPTEEAPETSIELPTPDAADAQAEKRARTPVEGRKRKTRTRRPKTPVEGRAGAQDATEGQSDDGLPPEDAETPAKLPRNPLFDVVAAELFNARTPEAVAVVAGRVGMVLKQLKALEVTAEEVAAAIAWWPKDHDGHLPRAPEKVATMILDYRADAARRKRKRKTMTYTVGDGQVQIEVEE